MNSHSQNIMKSGKSYEDMFEKTLIYRKEPYIRNKHKGIDFIIRDNIYVELKNMNDGGSVIEKIPHTIFKYYEMYKFKKIYIVSDFEEFHKNDFKLLSHIRFLEKYLKINVFITKMATFFDDLDDFKPYEKINPQGKKFICMN